MINIFDRQNKISNFLVKNKYILYISGGITAIAVATLLITKSLPINQDKHLKYKETLENQQKILNELSQSTIKLKFNYLNYENILAPYSQQLANNQDKLKQIPTFFSSHERKVYQIELAKNTKLVKKQTNLLQNIQTKQRNLNNSCRYINSLSNKAPLDNSRKEKILATIDRLLDNLTLYCSNSNEELIPQINQEQQILQQLKQEQKTQEYNLIVDRLLENSQIILQQTSMLLQDLARLEQVLNFTKINELENIYDRLYQKIVFRVNFYRLLTYIWSLLILIVVAYQIISNLSKTNRNIIQILEGFTEELETKVEQRTAQLEESVKETKAALTQAQEADRAKSRFLANMSHELRTPLNAILGFTQLMSRDSSVPQEHQETVGIINRSGEHLLKLINDILEMSKIEVGQTQLNENAFDLYLMLKSLEEMLGLKAEAKNLKLIFSIDNNIPQYIKADEGKLRQIVINLLSNGLKFTEKGSVTLTVKAKNKSELSQEQVDLLMSDTCILQFEIIDTGPGIEPEGMKRLFTPFEQTEVGIKSKEGTGLGLSISKKFIELMGGKLVVDSVVGKGTVFSFDVLAHVVETDAAINRDRHHSEKIVVGLAPDQEILRILAVDDVPQSRLLLRKMLTSVGFEVAEAGDGEEAIAVWQAWQPHLIFMDMRMPVMDGYEATKRIKSQSPGRKTVIIALTASAFEEERIVILSAGCDDFMRKPFYEAELFDKIAQHLKVDYVYGDNPNQAQPSQVVSQANLFPQLTPESLAVMPIQWRTHLHQAATQVDNQQILKLLAEIPAEYESLARDLTTLVEQFRCDKIIDLTESVKQ